LFWSERRTGARISRVTAPGIDEFTMTTADARIADASGDFLSSGVVDKTILLS
jgi:hypothetical protein